MVLGRGVGKRVEGRRYVEENDPIYFIGYQIYFDISIVEEMYEKGKLYIQVYTLIY